MGAQSSTQPPAGTYATPQPHMGSPGGTPMGPPGVGPYYGYAPQRPPISMSFDLPKKLIFLGNALAVLLVWIALMVLALASLDLTGFRAVRALYLFGTLVGFASCLLGALGSSKTDPYQNLGLFLVSGFWVFAMTFGFASLP